MKRREVFIDITRALAMFLIILGHVLVHSQHCKLIFKFIYSFHVVLFFIISGYTFKIENKEKFSSFFVYKFKKILVPYFIWAFLFLIPYSLFGKQTSQIIDNTFSFNIVEMIKNIFYGNGINEALKQNTSLWFLPALFTTEILYYLLIKQFNQNKKYILLIIMFISGYVYYNFVNINLPFGLNSFIEIGIFFYIGYLLKKENIFAGSSITIKKISVFVFLIIGLAGFYHNSLVSCVDYEYGKYMLFLVVAFSNSMFFLILSFYIKSNMCLEFIGRNTMGILIFHKLIVIVFQTKMGFITSKLLNSNIIIELGLSIIISIISIIFSLLINEILKKTLPFTVGK